MCIVVRLARNLLVLYCCSFLSGHRLILCAVVAGTAESVPSYHASWMAVLLGSVLDPLLLPCSSRRPLGIVPSSARQPLGRFVPHPPVGVLPAPSQALGLV